MTAAKIKLPGPAILRSVLVHAVLASGLGLLAGTTAARADDISGYVEFGGARTDTTQEGATGPALRFHACSFVQRYRFDVFKSLLPNLSVQGGGLFERDTLSQDTGGAEERASATKLRPYLALRFRSGLEQAELTWDRNEQTQRPRGASSTGLVRERASAAFGWTPDALPSLKLRYEKTDSFDRHRKFTDTTDNRFQLTSESRPIESLRVYYNGALSDTTDRIHGNDVRSALQGGRITFSDSWWKGRVTLYSDYNVNSRRTRTATAGTGDVIFLIPPFGGLSKLDDTPELGALDPTPGLVDGNLAAGSGIDLGLPPPGGDRTPRNIGIDLGRETEVNTLYLWVDRDLRTEIASSFAWKIYSSNDNRNWTLMQTVSPAPFGPFLFRFEIDFPNVTARYVKAVTPPLAADVPFASGFPTILVTEIEALIRRPVGEIRGRDSSTSQIYTMDARARLLASFPLYYEVTYFLTKAGQGRAVYTLSNGLSVSGSIDESASFAARVSREDGHERTGDRVAYVYTGSLTAAPIPTLRHSLVFSGTNENVAGRNSDIQSLFLNSVATLYRGVETGFSFGRSYSSGVGADDTRGTLLNANATLVPHELMTVSFSYRSATDDLYGSGGRPDVTSTRREGEGGVAWRPLPALYMFGSYRLEMRTGEDRRGIRNYSFDWSPFPQGTLHFTFGYNETYRSAERVTDRILTPALRWDITRRSFFDVSYQKISTDASVQRSDTSILSANLRISY